MIVSARDPFTVPANYFADALRIFNVPIGSMLVAMMILEVFRMQHDIQRRLTLIAGIAFVCSALYSQVTFFGYPLTARTILTFVGTVVGLTAAVLRLMDRT